MTAARSTGHVIPFDKKDLSTWGNTELLRFIAWNFAKNDPDSMEQFQAMRDLERSVEEDAIMQRRISELEQMKQEMDAMRYSSPYSQSLQTNGTQGFWESFRNMVAK